MADGDEVKLTTSAYLNSFKSVTPHLRSTGLRTAQLKYSGFAADHSDISAEFLLNSRYHRGDREFEISVHNYFEDTALKTISQIGKRMNGHAIQVDLPSPLPLGMEIQEAIAGRRSRRDYSGEPLTLEQLSTLLLAGGGITAYATTELKAGGECKLPLRAAPSGGGLYPVDTYVGARQVNGLAPGLYRFMNEESALISIPTAAEYAIEKLFSALPGVGIDIDNVSAVLVLVARQWRSKRKYGARGLRFTLMEAGYICQNIHLAATALGLPSCDFGGFYDDEINDVFDLNGASETVIGIQLLGG